MTAGTPPSISPPDAVTLQYAGVDHSRRPAIVAALAICSIVFGSIGLLVNGLHSVVAALDAVGSSFLVGPSVAGTTADTSAPNSLSVDESKLIASTFAELQTLSDQERDLLAHAIRVAEAPLAPPVGGAWTADHVKTLVASSLTGEPGEPYDEEGGEQGTYEEREVYFDMGASGEIWVYEDCVYLTAWPLDGRTVESTVWLDGTVEVTGDDEFLWDVQIWLTVALGLAATGLAVMLITAGIQTLRDKTSGLRLHRTWAWLRIALAVPALAVAGWGTVQVGDFIGMGSLFWVGVVAGVVVQIAMTVSYPLVVLFLLRTQRIRDWQGRVASGDLARTPAGKLAESR